MIIVGRNAAARMPPFSRIFRKSFRFKGAASSSAPFVLAQGGRSQAVPKSPNTAQRAHGAELGWCFLCHRPFPGAFLPGFSSMQRVETFYSGYFQFRWIYVVSFSVFPRSAPFFAPLQAACPKDTRSFPRECSFFEGVIPPAGCFLGCACRPSAFSPAETPFGKARMRYPHSSHRFWRRKVICPEGASADPL